MNLIKKAGSQNKSTELFLENKKKKKWIDEKSGHYCFMLYPRSLFVTMGHLYYWDWKCFKETSDENIEVVKLQSVCWLDVRGKLNISDISPGVNYEITYEVKLSNSANGWELPITLRVSLPNGMVRERKVSLFEKPRGKWIELKVGNMNAAEAGTGEVSIDLYEHGGHWKSGLIIRGITLRPKI